MNNLPKYTKSNKKGRTGLNYLTEIIEEELDWIVRPTHLENDFGIDAYIDITIDRFVTGKSIAVQVKSGSSYLKEINEDFWIFHGERKHLNYYLNHDIPVLIILVDKEKKIAYWEVCEIENINMLTVNWSMPIPKQQQVNKNQKNELLKYVSKGIDYVSQLEGYWKGNKTLSESGRICLFAGREDIQIGNYEPLIDLIERICSNKFHLVQFRENIEIGIHDYDKDSRELYEIPEVKEWVSNIFYNVPGLSYFLVNDSNSQFLRIFLYSTVESLTMDKTKKDKKIWIEYDPKVLSKIFEILYADLNSFTVSFEISEEINEKISRNIVKCIIGKEI